MKPFFDAYEKFVFGTLIVITILIRYPRTPHEIGVDSFLIHQISNSISTFGTISWALSPFSLFGMYPLSYPSGLPTLLSIVSQLLGIDMETAILITSFILAILGTSAVYIMVKKLSENVCLSLLSAFVFSIAPVFIELTSWTATTRNLFIAFLPLLIWSIFAYSQTMSRLNVHLFLIILLTFVLLASHRLYFLLILIILSYIFSYIIFNIHKKSYLKEKITRISEKTFLILCICAFLFLFLIQFSGISIFGNILLFYQSGSLIKGTSPIILMINFIANYCGQIGILFPLTGLGVGLLLLKKEKRFNEIVIIFIVFLSAPLLFLKYYMPIFLLPIFSFLIGLTVLNIYRRLENTNIFINNTYQLKKKIFSILIIAMLLGLSLVFSLFVVQKHLMTPADEYNNCEWLAEETHSLAIFFKMSGIKKFSSSDTLIGTRISASSEVLNGGGFLDAYSLGSNLINKSEIKISPIPINKLNIESNGFFELTAPLDRKKDNLPNNIEVLNNAVNRNTQRNTIIYDNGIHSVAVL